MEDFHFLYAIKNLSSKSDTKEAGIFVHFWAFLHMLNQKTKKILNNFAFKFYNKIVNKDVELSKDLILKTLC